MTDAEGYVITFTYDAMDRVVTMTDAKGGVTRYTYTDRGEVATKTDAEGYVTSYEYDGNGNLVSKTDPDGYTTEYTYNALDLATKINYNDAKEVSYRYNKTGDLVSTTDWLGTTTFAGPAASDDRCHGSRRQAGGVHLRRRGQPDLHQNDMAQLRYLEEAAIIALLIWD